MKSMAWIHQGRLGKCEKITDVLLHVEIQTHSEIEVSQLVSGPCHHWGVRQGMDGRDEEGMCSPRGAHPAGFLC